MKFLLFSILAFIFCVNGCIAQQQQQQHKHDEQQEIKTVIYQSGTSSNYILDPIRKCNHTQNDFVSFEIFLKWNNLHLIDEESSYEYLSDGDDDDNVNKKDDEKNSLGCSNNNNNENEDTKTECHPIRRRLRKARSVFTPKEENFIAVEKILFIKNNNCQRSWDSIKCENVMAKTAEQLLGIKLCFYSQQQQEQEEKINSKNNNNKNNKERTSSSSFLLSSGLTTKEKRTPTINHPAVSFVSGLVASAPGRHFGTKQQQQQQQTTQQQQKFPITSGDNRPIILKAQLLNNGISSKFRVLEIALLCLDGSGAAIFSSATSKITCPSSSSQNSAAVVPTTLSFKVLDDSTATTNSQIGSIITLKIPTDATSCGTASYYHYSPSNGDPSVAVCRFQYTTDSPFPSVTINKRYQLLVSASSNSNSNSQSSSEYVGIRNYYNSVFQQQQQPEPGFNGVSTSTSTSSKKSTVTPIATTTVQPSEIKSFYGIDGDSQQIVQYPLATGVIEFGQAAKPGNGFIKSDVEIYMKQIGQENFYDSSKISYVGEEYFSILPQGESALDIEIVLGMALNTSAVFWAVGVGVGNSNDNFHSFVDAILGTAKILTTESAPTVNGVSVSSWSISYGCPESSAMQDSEKMYQTDQYYRMLQHAGVSVFASSGDSGSFNDNDGQLGVQFPANCPHIVSVGATSSYFQDDNNNNKKTEIACNALDANMITSSGGFSKYFDLPDYQKNLITSGRASAGMFSSNKRAVPDLSALGSNVLAVSNSNGGNEMMYGTSVSAPIMAAILTLLNNQKIMYSNDTSRNATETLRKAHYFFYSVSDGFFDVTEGNNCAGRSDSTQLLNFPTYSSCYFAKVGFDLVTGLGTPQHYPHLVQALTNYLPPRDTPSPPAPNPPNWNQDAENLFDFVKKHYIYFSIGAGVVVLICVICVIYQKKKEKSEASRRLLGLTSNSSIQQEQGGDAGSFASSSMSYGAVNTSSNSRTTPRGRSPRNQQQQQQQQLASGAHSNNNNNNNNSNSSRSPRRS